MKTHIVKGLCVLAVVTGLITVPTSATLNTELDDIVPPELVELSFNPASVDVSASSQTVTATLRMTDELSGVSSACMFLFSPSQRQFRNVCGVPISGDAHDRVDQISIEFPQLSESGTWRVADLTVSDVVGNRRTLNESDLISRGLPANVQVVGGSDLVPPELVELSFNPASVDVSTTSQTVTATLRITDELSGVSSACMFLSSPSRQQFRRVCGVPISGDAHDRVDQISIEFPRFSESGSWRVADLTVSDVVGNRRTLNESDLISRGLPATVNVISNPHDVVPPELIELSFNPASVDVSNSSQTVTATLRITDELSGVSSACMFLSSPSRQQFRRVCGVPISGDAHDRVDQISIEFPQLSESGSWRVADLTISDVVGNRRTLNELDLMSQGLPATLQVTVNHPPVAICQTVIKTADNSCSVGLSANEMDNGSFDPDGDPLTLSVSPAGPFSLGTTSVTLTVTDDDGASSTCTSTVTVVDATPPIISNVPADITASATSASGAVVSYLIPTAADSCDAAVAVDCSPQLGSTFPLGSTPVTCSATDGSNNTSFENFTVNVLAADLVITKAAAPSPVTTRSNLTYLITVTNAGPGVAFGVTVSDMIPAGATFVSGSTGAGVSCVPDASGLLICGLDDLPSGSSGTVTLTVYVTAVANSSVSNTASVSATTYDPNMTNNTATVTTPVTGGTPPDPGPPPSPGPPGGSPPRGKP